MSIAVDGIAEFGIGDDSARARRDREALAARLGRIGVTARGVRVPPVASTIALAVA